MKPLHIGLGVLAIAALFLLTPPETKDSLGESWRRLSGDPGQACFDHERASLNDPITAKLQSRTVDPSRQDEVTITFQAKNPFGTYLSTTAICVVKSGKVDVPLTKVLRVSQTMDAGIKCLEGKIANRRAGSPVSLLFCSQFCPLGT